MYRLTQSILFDLDYHTNYEVEIIGTDKGSMDLSVIYQTENGASSSTRNFKRIPIDKETQIKSSMFDAVGAFVLYQNAGANKAAPCRGCAW